MNTANIKKYAPKARNNFIAAVTKQAARYGITAKGTEPMEQRGDIALIGENAFPKAIAPARKALERMVEQMGFAQAMEQAAYSWFNRLCAIRYMEIHDFLDHGRRVLSTANGEAGTPQILDDCLDISLPGLDPQQVAELKLDGNKDEELYRELLLAQCHALHEAMPFLFEAVDDATELLLPDNLTKTDSLIRELVSAIPEDDWQDVEIIGWLYQFYISEKKDQVIGEVVKSEDIPAATQLFTPNWIVQYLVQNSVGRQWLQTYPDSPLRDQMPYFIEPGKQSPEVQAQLDETVPDAIDPESITVLDPACGSGHILVEAYKILKAIYEERGYRSRDIPQQILKHNLFGLDIDDRAGQLAGFALMMLAREDDRRLFSRVAEGDVTLNVLSLKETGHLDLPQLWQDLNLSGDWQQGSSQSLFESEQADLSSASADERYQLLQRTLERFEDAKTFGSLIKVPEEDAAPLKALVDELEQLARTGDVMQKPAAEMLLPYVQQAWVLAQRYDAVIANPPYMGSKGMNAPLKKFAKDAYPNSKSDLFAIFMERGFELTKPSGNNSQVNMQSWMFSQSYEKLRKKVLGEKTISSLVHVGFNSFPTLNTKVVLASAFSILNKTIDDFRGTYVDLNSASPSQNKRILFETERETRTYEVAQESFLGVPGCPISFWYDFSSLFSSMLLGQEFESGGRCKTHNDERYVRYHWEVSRKDMFPSGRWKLYEKGGDYRKWYGNQYSVIDWQDSSREHYKKKGGLTQERFWSREGITWSDIALVNGFRLKPECSEYSSVSPTIFQKNSEKDLLRVLGFLNSSVAGWLLNVINPGIHANPGDVLKLPLITTLDEDLVRRAVSIVKNDWDREELSTGFSCNPIAYTTKKTVRESVSFDFDYVASLVDELGSIEKRNNKSLINSLGVIGQVSEEVESRLISLSSNPSYIAGKNLPLIEREERHRTVSIINLVSYAVGNMMGRYSLDKLGLILASQGETLLDYLRQIPSPSFTPDDDAILPLTDQEWFTDDATNRFREFVRVVWGDEHLQENLDFVAESLCLHAIKPKRGESAMDTIRRYLSTQFYKDHLRTYKKRPIYWLFSSGKHKAFECLVYLHRYNEGTLARMRTEYVIPLSAKLNAYAEKLEQDKDASTSAAETKRLEKEIATLHKQQSELAEFDEKLRHYADQRISLDLDDGVKVNYGKFGDLLAEVKAVTGDKPQ
jgi:type II restriction/modification system DNA methylase subunit YeeA